MPAYYNEHDPFAAAWLRELIKAGHIAPGEVDERSIEDVRPDDFRSFTQCHFFAGIGVWSYALRRAQWPDTRGVWTGSCPCQPFSAAGKRAGVADERHLWPAFYYLIRECSPRVVFGEQVASKDGLAWFDTVQADLEGSQYTVGAADLCSAGFGAPHIRQRLYFVAESQQQPGREERANVGGSREGGRAEGLEQRPLHGSLVELADSDGLGAGEERQQRSWELVQPCQDEIAGGRMAITGSQSTGRGLLRSGEGSDADVSRTSGQSERPSRFDGVAQGDTRGEGLPERIGDGRIQRETLGAFEREAAQRPGLTNGFWRDAEWIFCRDGKYRPIEPGSTPLATGITNRVGKLRGYGNALTAEVAKGFIESYLEVEREIRA